MDIRRDHLEVGTYYVLKVDVRSGKAEVSQYHTDYTKALEAATCNYSPDFGYKMLVVEVQGVVQGQGNPNVVTSLTRRM